MSRRMIPAIWGKGQISRAQDLAFMVGLGTCGRVILARVVQRAYNEAPDAPEVELRLRLRGNQC